jgi:hypothetical protein
MRYVKVEPPLRSGIFGTVYKFVNMDTGKFMTVKILEQPGRRTEAERGGEELEFYQVLKRGGNSYSK